MILGLVLQLTAGLDLVTRVAYRFTMHGTVNLSLECKRIKILRLLHLALESGNSLCSMTDDIQY